MRYYDNNNNYNYNYNYNCDDDFGYGRSYGRSMSHTCTVCGRNYSADYCGQFPVCHSCQWGIYAEHKEYWYCNTCGTAKLCTPGLGGTYCCEGDTFHVSGILNYVNLSKLDKWGHKHGYEKPTFVNRWAIVKGGQLGMTVCKNNLIDIEVCTGEYGTPFRFEDEEDARTIAKQLQADSILEVCIPSQTTTISSDNFFHCPLCGKLLPGKDKVEKAYYYTLYGCRDCGVHLSKCTVCGVLGKARDDRSLICSDACKAADDERKRLEAERLEREHQERIFQRYLEDREAVKKSPGRNFVLHFRGEENAFIGSARTDKPEKTTLDNALTFPTQEKVDDALALFKTHSKLELEVETTNMGSSYYYHSDKLCVCPFCSKLVLFEYVSHEESCPHCSNTLRFCSDCSEMFFVNDREMNWFTKKGLSIPKRCKPCRSTRVRY